MRREACQTLLQAMLRLAQSINTVYISMFYSLSLPCHAARTCGCGSHRSISSSTV